MHAWFNHYHDELRRRGDAGRALALLACLATLCAAAAQGQSTAPPVVVGPAQGRGAAPAATGAAAPLDPITQAAQALLKAAGVNAGAEPTAPGQAPAPRRANPFNVSTGGAPMQAPAPPAPATAPLAPSAEQGMTIPARPADPEKVQVDESDGLISLMVREGSLRQVIAMVAETQKLNIVFAGSADTFVTASFDRQPWQTVLDALLAASGHVWAMRDNVIFVSSIDNADFLPPGAEGRRVAVYELDFVSAVDVDQTVKGLLSPAGSSWLVESATSDNRRTKESIAVCDYPPYLARVSDYICQADQPPRQVYIEAHILQVELEDECRSGVNFENLISASSADITLRSVGFANGAAPTAFFVEPDGAGLDGLIELLKNTTDAKTLASPKIHAVSGQESRTQIGGQLGYRVTTTTQTSTMESVQFLDVGVVLTVTPRITRDGRVMMRIYPKVSTGQVDAETGLPSEETTEVETDVLVNSGEGVVIGGLIQEVDNNLQNKIPLLGDIPFLGVLFQKRQITRSRQEIIVTLQPHVLPYEPIVQARLEHEFMRTALPLTQGAICSYPRPFEPRMRDVLNNNKPLKNPDAESEQLLQLPPVEGMCIEDESMAPIETYRVPEIPLEQLPAPSLAQPLSLAPDAPQFPESLRVINPNAAP